MSLLLVIYGLVRGLSFMLRNYFAGIASQAFIRHQKSIILESAMRSQNQMSSFEVTTAFNDNVAAAGVVLQNLNMLACNAVAIFLFFVYGVIIAPFQLLIGFLLLFLVLLPTRSMDQKIKKFGEAVHRERESVNRTLNLGLKNNFFLRLYGLIGQEVERGKAALDAYKTHFQKFTLLTSARTSFPLTAGIFVISIISLASASVLKTEGFKLLAFFYIFIRLVQNMSDAYSIWGDMRMNLPALKALYQWSLRAKNYEKEQLINQLLSKEEISLTNKLHIEAQGVSFGYGSNPILKEINFKLGPGEIMVVHGESGSGKSTLLSLIVGILKPSQGSIHINGINSSELASYLGRYVGYVGPDPYLIPGTIKENLLYGMNYVQNPSEDDFWECLKFAEIDSTIRAFPNELNEHIHEWAQLSTGQRQRLAIARAMLRKPKLVILDEATANLDEKTELGIIHGLQKIQSDTTMIIVSHKKSFDAVATQTLHLHPQT